MLGGTQKGPAKGTSKSAISGRKSGILREKRTDVPMENYLEMTDRQRIQTLLELGWR